jgi:hypothetical protein
MTPIALPEQEHGEECWTREYWLDHCEGFGVESPQGRIGWVDEIVRAAESDEPVALIVRGGVGAERGTFVVPVEQIRELHPLVERIVVGDAAAPAPRASQRAG